LSESFECLWAPTCGIGNPEPEESTEKEKQQEKKWNMYKNNSQAIKVDGNDTRHTSL
jgi:hypothetical protein